MDQVLRPVILTRIDIVTEGFNGGFVGALRRAICFRVKGCGHAQVGVEFLKQSLPETAREELVVVRCDRSREAKSSVPGLIE